MPGVPLATTYTLAVAPAAGYRLAPFTATVTLVGAALATPAHIALRVAGGVVAGPPPVITVPAGATSAAVVLAPLTAPATLTLTPTNDAALLDPAAVTYLVEATMLPLIGFFTDYAKNLENNLWHLGAALTAPATLYLGLTGGDPLRSGGLGELTAGGAPGYARAAAGPSSWATSAAGLVTNTAAIAFGPNSGASPWPVANSLFAADAATGGNIIWVCRLAPDTTGLGQTLAVGKSLRFAVGTIAIQK